MSVPVTVAALTALVAAVGALSLLWSPRAEACARLTPRPMREPRNTPVIGGEFISAAAFLGTAGLALAYGAGMLWLPVGAAAGHVLLQVFVTAPLRRSGAFTLTGFAEWRLGSRAVRRAAGVCVCVTGWFCLLPQLESAGIALRVLAGPPAWVGRTAVIVVALSIVLAGGMRGLTAGRAFRCWFRLVAMAVPVVALLALWHLGLTAGQGRPQPPRFAQETTVAIDLDVAIRVLAGTGIEIAGVLDGRRHDGARVVLEPGTHVLEEGARLVFPAGARVPRPAPAPEPGGDVWAAPFGRGDHPLFTTYSVVLSVLLGTMGLPHAVGCFSAHACGRAARRTAALVPALLGLFCVLPALYGALGRLYTPGLLMTGDGDATVLMLPHRLAPGPAGSFLTGLVAAAAFAAFAAASCCAVVAIAGTVSHCGPRGGAGAFRLGAVVAVAVPLALVAWVRPLGPAGLVTLGCTVSACSLCPLLVLGLWWRRLTPVGAVAGLAAGCSLAVLAALTHLAGAVRGGWPGAVLAQPTVAIVPVTFAVMVGVSLLTPLRVPPGVDRAMARLHLPEGLTTDRAR
ncbi:sodium:solute symporter family transporter [Actinomadura scrupuli]|uniref:sodium:solute symporter family transporter n=1 Tax=Actinomadura scrupuli TaxID=559629 RepID=UPI003D961EDF